MNTLGIIIFGMILVFTLWIVFAAFRNRHNVSTFIAGTTYDVMSHTQKGATQAVVEYRAAKKLEEQASDEGDEDED